MTDARTSGIRSDQEPLDGIAEISTASEGRVQAFILLGGGLTASPLTEATRCSVLDLLVGPNDSTVFDRWMKQIVGLNGLAVDEMPVIIANGGGTPAPRLEGHQTGRRVEVVVDKQDFRGAAGVVCDVSRHLDDEALLLVAEAARTPDFDLAAGVRAHHESGFDATVLVNPDDTPAGVYLMARHLLKFVQSEGYMDLKEQWLTRVIASDRRVGVHRIANGYSQPIRTREQLLKAAGAAAGHSASRDHSLRFGADAIAATGKGFRCVAPDARVDASAFVLDSIIMPGASVGPSCVVTRSIVCTNCHVPAESNLVDAVYRSDGHTGSRSGVSRKHREEES